MVQPQSSEALRGRTLTHRGVTGEHEWLYSSLDHVDTPRDPESFCDPAWKAVILWVEKGMRKRSNIFWK